MMVNINIINMMKCIIIIIDFNNIIHDMFININIIINNIIGIRNNKNEINMFCRRKTIFVKRIYNLKMIILTFYNSWYRFSLYLVSYDSIYSLKYNIKYKRYEMIFDYERRMKHVSSINREQKKINNMNNMHMSLKKYDSHL